MHETHIRAEIQRALNNFADGNLAQNATDLLKVLGYESQRTLHRDTNTAETFLEDFDNHRRMSREKAHVHEWQTADFLFQLTADEIKQHTQETITFHEDRGVDNTIYYSYLFLAVELKGDTYSRTAFANITREINKLYAMPALLIFKHGQSLTFAIINRRPSQRDGDRDVLEKVVLIKDIDVAAPHRAHLDILADLSLDALYHRHEFTNFLELHQAWQKTLDTSELNRRFFKEIADWYFWAVEQVTFPLDKGGRGVTAKLRHLLSYNDEPHQFTDTEVEHLINAIDTLKILDPACGSGAFPMGILHKLVFLLGKLDPRNAQWRQRQIDRVQAAIATSERIDDSTFRESAIAELEREIDSINDAFERNALDYGRKLYLIENCIYGVDIQPIATQIAKLRFFISLIVEQRIDDTRENKGVRPLPNLETKFVAANTLLGVEKPEQMTFRNPEIDSKEKALAEVHRRHFTARTPRTKDRYKQRDAELRSEISRLLQPDGFPSETTKKIAHWDPYNQNASADFFDPEWMFGITEGFDVVIGNPPYVRQEKIKHLKPTLKKHYTCYTGAADLYVYFYERGLQLLSPSGIHTFICSNSWLDVNYGAPLQQYLLDNTAGAVICHSEAEREFESADINTIVSILHNGIPDAESHLRFLTFKTFIGDPDIENRRERMRTYTELAQAGTRENRYTGDKWGGKYLHAPDIYWTILGKGKDKLVRLGDVADMRRGFTTGANEFFYLDAERIQEWGIASQYLKPVIKSPRECKSIRVDPRQLQFKLFMCHADKAALAGTAALEYIRWGESQGYHQRPSCKGRSRWWDLSEESGNSIFVKEADETSAVFYNPDNYLVDCRLYYANLSNDILLFLNSAIGAMFFELYSRSGLGKGARSMMVSDYENVPTLTKINVDEETAESLLERISLLPPRRIVKSESEWSDLDAIIFDALGLTQGEQDGVYEAVVNLVESRLRKARSLKGKS